MPSSRSTNALTAGLVAGALGFAILLGTGSDGFHSFGARAPADRPDGGSGSWTMTAELRDLARHRNVSALYLGARFDASQFTLDNAASGGIPVPRVFLPALPKDLRSLDSVDARKSIFLRTLLPIVLKANEEIAADRRRLVLLKEKLAAGKELPTADRVWLDRLGTRYDTDPADFDRLMRRVDIVPVSLALAQAVEESGWGTSRFARQGNAIFGQYTTIDDHGMIPRGAPDDASFKIKAFPNMLAGVRAYMRNLNTHGAYARLRALREAQRADGFDPDGRKLAETLQGYSERGDEYIRTLHIIMDANGLDRLERNARLAEPVDHLAGSAG
ncbi:MAG: glucosaminidase domain-containing protein [Rhodospirillales bacterium]